MATFMDRSFTTKMSSMPGGLLLPHELCRRSIDDGGSGPMAMASDQIFLPHQLCGERSMLPHEVIGRSCFGYDEEEEILLPHQRFGSPCNRSSRLEDQTKISLKKDDEDNLFLPHELCSNINNGETNTEEGSCESRCSPQKPIGNESDVPHPYVIKKHDQNPLLPHQVCEYSSPCTLSIQIQMPHEQHPSRCSACSARAKDVVLLMNLAGASFELSVHRNL